MGFVKEFKEFAITGNVLDLAVGVIIGGAVGKIVNSLVEDIITPLLLNPALETIGAKNISELSWHGVKYGNFLSALLSFFMIALVLFSLIKAVNKLKKPAVGAIIEPSTQEKLLMEIRDSLRQKS